MDRKAQMDFFGIAVLTGFSLLLALNQVVIKLTNTGIQPVFQAGLRSVGAAVLIVVWMRWRGIPVRIAPGTARAGLLVGTLFGLEFLFLFLSLDLTTVTRMAVIFYSMPVWLALAAHFLLPGERITPVKGIGLALAFAGVALAIVSRGGGEGGGEGSFLGDMLALTAAIFWAGIALCVRVTSLRTVRAEMQLLWQLVVSAPILLGASLFFGPFLRDPDLTHWAGLAFQILAIASAGFLLWLWLLSIYPAASVASFSFLSPVFGVLLGWALLDEQVGWPILGALVLVCLGLVFINRPTPDPPR